MRYIILCFLISLTAWTTATAQRNLSGSIRHSAYTYAFKLDKTEAAKLERSNLQRVNDRYLHSRIDSFPTAADEPVLQPGNYLFVYAKNNELVYDLRTVGDVNIKLINNGNDIYVLAHTKEGAIIDDARLFAGNSRLRYDKQLKAYGPVKRKRTRFIRIDDKDVFFSFPTALSRPYRPLVLKKLISWKTRKQEYYYHSYFNGITPHESRFKGFIVFNKPKYKPGDTVRLKAFVEANNGRLIKSPLILRLSDRSFDRDTILATLHPYRPGGYAYQFVLTDSLDLDLDEDYLVTLEDPRSRKYDVGSYTGDLDDDEYALKRKVFTRGKFTYEEYELGQVNFTARSDKKEHSRGEEPSLFLKATDENELAVMDGRVQVIVQPDDYGSKEFHTAKLFLADTLWFHEQLLENVGETKIVLPDSIFPQASFKYRVTCNFLNANNERETKTLSQSFRDNDQRIVFELKKDSLFIDHPVQGRSVSVTAALYVFDNKDDTLEQRRISLPYALKINPFSSSYEVETDSADETYELKQVKGMVSCVSSRTKDSIAIQLINPNHLPVWYTIFAGTKIALRGVGDSLLYLAKTKTAKNYFVSLQYVFNNNIHKENYTIPFQDRLLTIKVSQPEVVYPGQSVPVGIDVTDVAGKPVAGADITAYAYTTKFHANAPDVPYLGKLYPLRKQKAGLDIKEQKEIDRAIQLNWDRWSREMHLDTIEYYKFLHPPSIYLNREPAPDSITQLAPFVVSKGDLQPVQLLYIDEKPVFFNQAQQLQRYSFRISEGKHSLRIRTQNKLISLDSIWMARGMKTFISINADTANESIRIKKMPDTLTTYEKALLSKYMILVTNNFGENFAYITQSQNLSLLNPDNLRYQPSILAGPFPDNRASLVVKNGFRQNFETEGSWQYTITQGLIRQKQFNNSYPFQAQLFGSAPAYNFHDFVLTENEIDSLWQDYLDTRSANTDLFYNAPLVKTGNGQLQVGLSKAMLEKKLFIKNVILFRYDNPDFIRIYTGTARDLGYVQPGKYRLLFLLKKDSYFMKDSITILKDGLNYYEVENMPEKQKDSVSIRISKIIESRNRYNRNYADEDLDQIKESFNEQYLDLSVFSEPIGGVVTDDKGAPVAGASIMVKGTKVGTSTDGSGRFALNAPAHGAIVVASVGYTTRELAIKPDMDYAITLKAAENRLDEVVVVGYGVTRKRELTGSISSVSADRFLQGRLPGLQIRGVNTTASIPSPLIIVDGLPYSGRMEDLDSTQISGINILKSEAAKAMYGARAAGGVIIITTKQVQLNRGPELPMAGNSLRHNFRDDAYWQPKLISDKTGHASFNVTFPDDITSWQTFVIAIGGRKQTGFTQGAIKSFKAISGNLALPQFAVIGDSVHVIGKALNYLPDSLQVKRSFSVNDQVLKEGTIRLRNSWIDTFSVVAPAKDSLKLKYTLLRENGYFDGEERTIPVFKAGVLETKGVFAALDKDTAFQLQFEADTSSIKVFAEASLLPVLYDETEKIRTYEYLCNEQLGSKLKAMLVQKKIDEYLKRPFKGEQYIRELIGKLNQSKSGSGLWGWWVNNDPSLWISLHVMEALVQARQAGYSVKINKALLTDYLVYNLENYKAADKVSCLYLLKQLDASPDYKGYIDSLEKNNKGMSLYDRLRITALKQETGLPVALDTLVSKAQHTVFGNLYWGEENQQFFDNSIQNTLCMYHILKRAGGYSAQLRKMRNYFLEKRGSGHWRNTYESSLIMEAILPDLLEEQASSSQLSLTLKGKDSITIHKFPYYAQLANSSSLNVTKTGAEPVYFTANQQHWNNNPARVEGNFIVRSFFEKNENAVSKLKAGEPVLLKVNVKVLADADYILVEVPIPAGCSYQEKSQSFLNGEVHREYFKNKVSVFCRSLAKGEYTFTISLMPRFGGLYTLNPSKVEMMYFPVFYGREAVRKVGID